MWGNLRGREDFRGRALAVSAEDVFVEPGGVFFFSGVAIGGGGERVGRLPEGESQRFVVCGEGDGGADGVAQQNRSQARGFCVV